MYLNHKGFDPFKKYLRNVSITAFFLHIIPIPTGIITARLISKVVDHAVGGQITDVLKTGIFLLVIVILVKTFQTIADIAFQKAKSNALHRCKMNLYQWFLSNPLKLLYSSEHGNAIEKLTDDFSTVTQKIISLRPGFWIGILTAAVYFTFLAFQNILVASVLIAFSFLQIIPPVIVKKYMQVNYDNCRDIEAKITDFTISGYRGFATIKLYQLEKWWLNKLYEYHKKYAKIGNTSIFTGTAESAMNDFVSMILKYGTYAVLGLFVLIQLTNIDVSIQAIALSGGLFSAVKTVFSSIPQFAVAKTAEKRIAEWFPENNHISKAFENDQITLTKVGKEFNGKEILNEVTASFSVNEICVIKGENGIGKSLTFKLITGLLTPDCGDITVGSVHPSLFSDSVFPEGIFYLPQEDAVFHFTPQELYEMFEGRLLPDILKTAKEFHLTPKQLNETKIKELSGGERKKVYLSLAIALDPQFLLLDEPTNSLDEESRTKLVHFLQNRKRGAIIITHDPVFDDIADCIYQMREGGIVVEKKRCS